MSQAPLARPALCRAPMPCHAARLPSTPSRAPRLSYRGPSDRVMGAGCALARPCRGRWLRASLAVSWALATRQPGCIAGLAERLAGRVVACLATRSSLMPFSLSHDTLQCIATHLLQQPNCRLSHDTNFVS